jgi:hypothetical protein
MYGSCSMYVCMMYVLHRLTGNITTSAMTAGANEFQGSMHTGRKHKGLLQAPCKRAWA